MSLHTVYVTVGTTYFNDLFAEIASDRVLQILQAKGCRKLILQIGNGYALNDVDRIRATYNIEVEQYKFKHETVRQDIINADLIIGHAGAGTCMDILNNNKHGLVVINNRLMNNHQMELAEQLARDKYIYYCTVEQLAQQLETLNFDQLMPYMPGKQNMRNFVEHLNAMMS